MTEPIPAGPNRREVLRRAASVAGAVTLGTAVASEERPALNGRLKQSVVPWCFADHWKFDELCAVASRLGCRSVELADVKDWPTLKKHGLVCALARSHGFERGMNNPKYQDECLDKLRAAIDACADAAFPAVITFTGFRENVSDEDGIKNCVAGYKKVLAHAEAKKVTLCLEMLNSRVNEKMKGHPGYQGDHIDYCAEIVKRVASPRLKLLFDVYHVQIMDGDLIARIRQDAEILGHVHTAGNPGRRELDDRQEINYRAVMQALADVKYAGYVGHEFIPTRDPLKGLQEAVAICTV